MNSDRHLLVDLFNRMSAQSVYLRFLRRLDALPENRIDKLLTINFHSDYALVAVVSENEKKSIIAVGRYGYDPDEGGTDLAVAVRDDWQQAGLGKVMLSEVVIIAKDHGIICFTGIMDPQNKTIQKLLVKIPLPLGLGQFSPVMNLFMDTSSRFFMLSASSLECASPCAWRVQ